MGPQPPNSLAMDALVHDLNNVLQTILQAAELLCPDGGNASLVEVIRRNVEQARRILGSPKPGKPMSLRHMIDSAGQFVADYVAVHGGATPRLVSTVAEDLGAPEPASVQRALVNLFLNSAQAAARAGRRQVTVRADARVEGATLVLTLTDDGPGLPGPLLDHIFTPLSGESNEGMGTGLRIVETAVRYAGGTIMASNAGCGGAVFTIRLPGTL